MMKTVHNACASVGFRCDASYCPKNCKQSPPLRFRYMMRFPTCCPPDDSWHAAVRIASVFSTQPHNDSLLPPGPDCTGRRVARDSATERSVLEHANCYSTFSSPCVSATIKTSVGFQKKRGIQTTSSPSKCFSRKRRTVSATVFLEIQLSENRSSRRGEGEFPRLHKARTGLQVPMLFAVDATVRLASWMSPRASGVG